MRRGRQPKRRRHIFIGLGGRYCLIPRHSINFQFHKTNLICRNISCSWRFRRCWSCNYRISRGGAIRCDADGSRREGIYLLGLGSCLVVFDTAIQSIFRFIKQTWYVGITPARGASGGVGPVIIVSAGAELYDATRTAAEEKKAYIYWAWRPLVFDTPPFNQFSVS